MKQKGIPVYFLLFLLMTQLNFTWSQGGQEDAKSLFAKAKASLEARDIDNAVKYMEQAVALNKTNSDYHYELGLIYNRKLNQVQGMAQLGWATKMKGAWEKAVDLNPESQKAVLALVGYYLNAPPIAGGSTEKAKSLLEKVIKMDPIIGYSYYVTLFMKEHDLQKAEESARRAVELHLAWQKKNPGKPSSFNANVLNRLGYGYLRAKQIDKAIAVFQENIRLFSEYFNVYDSLAEAYATKGDKKLAIKYYQKALDLNPQRNAFEKRARAAAQKNLDKLKSEKSDDK